MSETQQTGVTGLREDNDAPKQEETTDSETAVSNDAILEVENLRKDFGGLTAVDDLSFTVEPAEILGFIGPNGAGKSTTFNCITGFQKPTSGVVRYKGTDITGYPPYKVVESGINRTFQSFAPLEDRTVVENVELGLSTNSFFHIDDRNNSRRVATSICERLGLMDDLEKKPDELPHAGLIRLELGRAIATDPELLLVDEAFAGLSKGEVEEVSDVLRNLRDSGMTIVVVDHNMRGLLELIDRALVIQFGKKIAGGTPDEITKDPTVREAYLGGAEV